MLQRLEPHHLDCRGEADTDRLLQREWLLTNATGGYAMGTALGANTRRYHGLLVAAATPPVRRVVVLHQAVEELVLSLGDGSSQTLAFGPMLFRGGHGRRVVAPDCVAMLRRFDHDLTSTWSYAGHTPALDGLAFTRRLAVHDGKPACTLHYDVHGLGGVCESATLRLRPMITLRGFHGLASEHDAGDACHTYAEGDTLRVRRGDTVACYRMNGAALHDDPQWWHGVDYPADRLRGQGDREDYFAPAVFELPLPAADDATATLTATLGGSPASPQPLPSRRTQRLAASLNGIVKTSSRGTPLAPPAADALPLMLALARAADDFVVSRDVGGKTLSTIIAGYPWFADWGRDTFIALPGLLLCTGRHAEARDTLAAFAAATRGGLVPNRFDDDDPAKAHYNTADASLWFIHSALEYLEHTGDTDAWDGWLARACIDIVNGYAEGTHADAHDGGAPIPIAMDADGLIAAGNEHSQLTWMDAAAPDPGSGNRVHVFTPRPGKCVEINALWHSALARLGERLPEDYRAERERCAGLAERVSTSFSSVFWSDELGHLVDHLAPDGGGGWVADRSLRPNMVIACALEHSPARAEHRAASLAAARDKLLTPAGLRTLPRDDPEYHNRYAGTAFERDGAYHRGTVWPWLIGPYAEAVLRAGRFSDDAKREANAALAPLLERLTTATHPGCLGQLHEIHEPEPPYEPRGCPAQAWSVAEALRVWCMIHR